MILETDRLYIRNLDETDWQEMKKIFIDFNSSKYSVYDMPLPIKDEEIKALTKRFAESDLFFAVFFKELGDMLGYVCFHRNGDKYDLGYCFHSAYHSNGYAYESTKALIEYFISERGAIGFTAGTACLQAALVFCSLYLLCLRYCAGVQYITALNFAI